MNENSHDQLDPCLMVRKRTDNGKERRKGSGMPLDKRETCSSLEGKAPHYKKKKRKRKREVRDLSSWSPKGLALGITNRQRVPTIESKQRGTEPLSPVDERKSAILLNIMAEIPGTDIYYHLSRHKNRIRIDMPERHDTGSHTLREKGKTLVSSGGPLSHKGR